ncbi:DUF2808 domain-containing protein [Phormidesmis priestleyi]
MSGLSTIARQGNQNEAICELFVIQHYLIFIEVTMSQIREVITWLMVSTILGISTAANAEQNMAANNGLAQRDFTVAAASKQDRAIVSEDTYSIAMTLPNRANNSFSRLSFSFTKPDQENEVAPVYLNSMATTAFVGNSSEPGAAIAVESSWIDETGTVWVEFNSAVPANTPLTVVFKTRKPLSVGLYQYSIAAYPTAKSSGAVFVGNGILNIAQ